MKTFAIASVVLALGSGHVMAAGGPLTFVGNTASFSSSVSGVFNDIWTFNVAAPGASAAASVTNIEFNGAGGIGAFSGVLAFVPLAPTAVVTPPVVVNVLSGFTGVLPAGPYTLTIGGNAGSGASYGGNVVLTPVPEPETYALMLAGLGIVGFIASRRRSRV